MSVSRPDAAANRVRIVEAARGAIAGGETRLNAIARRAGVGQGTLYRHFPTREDLLAEVYRADVDALVDAADALLAELPPVAALEAWLARLTEYARVKRGVMEALQAPAWQGLVGDSHGPIAAAVTRLLEAGQADGSLRADADVRDVFLLTGVLTRIDEDAWEPRAARAMAIVLDGLRAR